MRYEQYAKRAAENGIKLSVPISPDILYKLTTQSEIYDVIWASQASSKENLKTSVLSMNVMGEIRRLAGELLLHPAFKKYSGMSEIEKRADRHYKSADEQTGFDKRQDAIRDKLGLENKQTENQKKPEFSDTEIPTREDVERILRPLGGEVTEDVFKAAVAVDFAKKGRMLNPNWWEITKRNLIEWSKKK
jgi:hypothetical protein